MREASSRQRVSVAPESQRFVVGKRLGAGGMGVVYEAFDRERQARVALKTIPRLEADALLRLKNEFHGLLDLHHPNLVDLGDLVAEGHQWFFTMELVDGCDFLEWVRRAHDRASLPTLGPSVDTIASAPPVPQGAVNDAAFAERVFQHLATPSTFAPPDMARLRSVMAQLASGLCALHDAKKIHRDVKPPNVLVTREGRLVLLDFGLILDLVGARATPEPSLVGTIDYMAPEQAGSRDIGPAADWYAVGVMLYEALTGHLPFHGTSVEVLVAKQLREPPRPSHVVPGVPEDLDRLTVDLLRRIPEARPPGWEVLRRLGGLETSQVRVAVGATDATRSRFVGRSAELERLHSGLDDVRSGRGRVVCVAGPSGVGKSTLVRKFLQSVKDTAPEAIVLAGRCYERDSVPFKAVDGVIDALTHHLRSMPKATAAALLPPDAALLSTLFPVLARIEAIAAAGGRRPSVADPQNLRPRAFAALRALLSNVAEGRPLVVTIDDLQWADGDSLALLAAVLAPPDAPPLYLLTTVRTESPDEAVRLVGGLPKGAELVPLDALRSPDAAELARLLLATSGKDGDADDIAREAHGHPLFIDELVRHLAGGHATQRGLRLDDAILARVVRLDAASRSVLEVVASATGRPTLALVADAAELSMTDIARCLSGLRAERLVRTTGTKRTDAVEAYHDRVREAVLGSLRTETSAYWHRRLALTLEAAGNADAEALAYHWSHANEHDRARGYAVRAAEEATGMLAFERAARLFAMAIGLLTSDAPERARLLARRALALANAGRGPEAGDAYLDAASAASNGERVELSRLAAEQLLRSGYVDRGAAVIREVLDAVDVSLPSTTRRALVSLLYHRARIRVRGLGWKERDQTTLAPSVLSRIDTCWSVGMGLGMVDTLRAADFQARNVLLALESGEPNRIARALALEAGFVSSAGGPAQPRARQLLAKATDLAARLDDPRAMGFVLATAGVVPYMAGRWSEALAAFELAEQKLVDGCTGMTWELDSVRQFSVSALYCVGRLRDLVRRVPELVRDAEQRGDLFAATNFRTGLPALSGLVLDDPEGTRRGVHDAMSAWSRHGFHAQHFYAMNAEVAALLYEGRGAEARTLVHDRWSGLERSMLTRVQIVRLTALDMRARSSLAAARDAKGTERAALLRAAERDARTILGEKMQWASNLAELASAGVAWTRGDLEGALRWLDRASEGFASDDAAIFGAVARWRRGELIGGVEGRELIAAADAALGAEGVRDRARWVQMLAPWGNLAA